MAKTISWLAPTTREDGSALDPAALVYDMGIADVPGGALVDLASFPGTLNPDGRYEVAVADLALPEADIEFALAAKDEQGRRSVWSNRNMIYLGKPPAPPTEVLVIY